MWSSNPLLGAKLYIR